MKSILRWVGVMWLVFGVWWMMEVLGEECLSRDGQTCGSQEGEPLEESASVVSSSKESSSILFRYFATNSTMVELPAFAKDTDWKEIWASLQQAVLGTLQMLHLWARFGLLLSRPIFQCCGMILEALAPHVRHGLYQVWIYLRNLPPLVQLQLLGVIGIIGFCYRMGYFHKAYQAYQYSRTKIVQHYRSFVSAVYQKSQTAALALPHVLYMFFVILLIRLLPAFVMRMINQNDLVSLLALWWPFLGSVRTLFRFRDLKKLIDDENSTPKSNAIVMSAASQQTKGLSRRRSQKTLVEKSSNEITTAQSSNSSTATKMISDLQEQMEDYIKYWVVWGLCLCTLGILSFFTPQRLSKVVILPNSWIVAFLLWIQLPWTSGYNLVYSLIAPYVHRYGGRMPKGPSEEKTGFVFRALSLLGIVPQYYIDRMKDLWSQGPVLLGFFFVFTPGFITYRGCLLIGMGLPAYISIGLIANKSYRNYEWWLTYYCVLAVVESLITAIGVVFSWVPLFYHVKLIIFMSLQFPYFCGAERIMSGLYQFVGILRTPVTKPNKGALNILQTRLSEKED